ncbi:MAG: hypothetical protein JXQ30_01740 [Spirochaetes bacterium]|nr:hypothetical protein [Spirochaetota bacterium]
MRTVAVLTAALIAASALLPYVPAEATWMPENEKSAEILKAAEEEAVRWLIRRMVPNETVPDPVPFRRRLLLSYLVPETDPTYPYVFGRSFIYDDAVGAVALTMAGRYREAERVLTAMRRAMNDDGSFFFVYNTHNSWPNKDDHNGSLVRTGSVAWAGYAIVFYLLTRTGNDPAFMESDPLAPRFLQTAERIARYLSGLQIKARDDPRFGLLTGGVGTYTIGLDEESGEPVEEYDPSSVDWASTEHNIDAYFFLRDLETLTSDEAYSDAADRIRNGLFSLWSEKDGQFYRGISGSGSIDRALPLDCASWGSMFLFAAGDEQKGGRCLETAEARFRSSYAGIPGYKPYHSGTLYEEGSVNEYYSGIVGSSRWEDAYFVWGEGSFGVSAAYSCAGKSADAYRILSALLPLQTEGGFPYSTTAIPYQFSIHPSVASTGWFIIAARSLLDEEMGARFWGRE